jgi:hypothetical protein
MIHPRFRAISAAIAGMVLVLFLIPSCHDTPTSITDSSTLNQGNIDPNGGTDFTLGSVAIEQLDGGRIEVLGKNLTTDESGGSFDLVLVNRSRQTVYPPVVFYITRITPPDVVLIGDFADPHQIDFSSSLGDDGVLAPGEATGPIRVPFAWPEPMSFSMAFRIDVGSPTESGVISGVVFNDLNKDGMYQQAVEPGIPGAAVELSPAANDSVNHAVVWTDAQGHYAFRHLRAGVYTVHATLPPVQTAATPTTPNPLLVTLVKLPDGTVSNFDKAHFGFFAGPPPIPPELLFGPVMVGPMSQYGTKLDSSFTSGRPKDEYIYDYFLSVVAPPIASPIRMRIDSINVRINDHLVYDFHCPIVNPDSMFVCEPDYGRMKLDEGIVQFGENKISIEVIGSDHALVTFIVDRVPHY